MLRGILKRNLRVFVVVPEIQIQINPSQRYTLLCFLFRPTGNRRLSKQRNSRLVMKKPVNRDAFLYVSIIYDHMKQLWCIYAHVVLIIICIHVLAGSLKFARKIALLYFECEKIVTKVNSDFSGGLKKKLFMIICKYKA